MFDFIVGAKAKLIALLISIVSVILGFFVVRHKYIEQGKEEVTTAATEKALERVLKAENIGKEIDTMTEEKVDAELQKWMRKDSDSDK